MKFILTLLLCTLSVFTYEEAFASHGMGGELTWICQGNGTYKFRLKLYRDCNGITSGLQLNMQTNHPLGAVLLSLVQQSDISSTGFDSSGTAPCANCSMGSTTSPIIGLVEELIYESQDVTLTGVPPPGGWWFGYSECCRSSQITNMGNAGSNSFFIFAKMFAYDGQSAMPCYDSSPYFTEKPMAVACTGLPYQIQPGAVDADGDAIHYSWDYLSDSLFWNLSFLPGYSVNSPFPDTTQDPLNVAASLNTVTGFITGLNHTAGCYAHKIKASSYKCGQKVAEVSRDFSLAFIPGCPTILGNMQNTAPTIIPPFINPATGSQTSFADTVMAGDTVTAMVAITDVDYFTDTTSQLLTISGAGTQFGTYFIDPLNGCPLPPCATLSAVLPQSVYVGSFLIFNWITTCAHAADTTSQCGGNSNTYVFNIWADDNYCPANARAIATISITVVGAAISIPAGGTTFCTTDAPVNLTAWPPGGTWSGFPLGSGNVFDPSTGAGDFTVYYTWSDSSGCTSTAALTLNVNDCTGIEEFQSYSLALHPNPATDHIFIDGPSHSDAHIAIINIMGQQVYESVLPADNTFLLPILPNGIYLIELRDATTIGHGKLIVQQN
ncbi:MAG TPA: T9SS type A sorting domain-containing protein [Bacteroidia bacterium]|nr:T9SS type A sorting domain-containing protein [Bacteroidia bacterium]